MSTKTTSIFITTNTITTTSFYGNSSSSFNGSFYGNDNKVNFHSNESDVNFHGNESNVDSFNSVINSTETNISDVVSLHGNESNACFNGTINSTETNISDVLNLHGNLTSDVTGAAINSTKTNASSVVRVPEGCVRFPNLGYVPWNNPQNLISKEVEEAFDQIVAIFFLNVCYLICLPTHILSMIVFAKQGLKERVNLILFFQSLIDLIYMTASFVLYCDRIPRTILDLPRKAGVFKFMMNNPINILFRSVWMTRFLTTLIACERCFCVISPIKAKQMLKTNRMLAIILFAAAANYSIGYVLNAKLSVTCVYDATTNTTSETWWPTKFFIEHREVLVFVEGTLYGIILSSAFIIISVIATIVTVHGLRKMMAWRHKTTSSMKSSVAMTSRDVALTRMLIGCTVLFVVCSFPPLVFRTALPFVPDLSMNGRYANMWAFMVSFSVLFNYCNSSLNFFIYYAMGTRYRETLHALFASCSRARDGHVTVKKTLSVETDDCN